MASELSNLLFLVSLTLVLVFNVTVVNAQTTNPVTFNGSYRVKPNDTKRFDIIKLTNSDNNYYPYPFVFKNRSLDQVNLTQGEQIVVKVAEVNSSTTNLGQVYSNLTFVTSHHVSHLPLVDNRLFIYPCFDSYSQAESYINGTNNSSGSNSSYSQSGDIITSVIDINLDIPVNGSITLSNTGAYPRDFQYITSFNWQTGWLQYYHYIASFGNGSQEFNFFIQQQPSKDVISTLFSFFTSFFERSSLIVAIAVIVIIGLSYYSYSKISKTSDNSPSFSQYLKNRFTYRKKDAYKMSGKETDKAIQTIETILDEIKDNSD